MEILDKIIEKELFEPKVLPNMENGETLAEFGHSVYNMIQEELSFSNGEAFAISNHFVNTIVLFHPDTDLSVVKLITHYCNNKKSRYVTKCVGYEYDDFDKSSDSEVAYQSNPENDKKVETIDRRNWIKLKPGNFNAIIKCLADHNMINRHKIWDKFYYDDDIICPICHYKSKFQNLRSSESQ